MKTLKTFSCRPARLSPYLAPGLLLLGFLLSICALQAAHAQPPGAVVAAPAASSYWSEPATVWDVIKFGIPFLIATGLWAIRVEMRLSRHGDQFEAQAKSLQKIESLLEDWTGVKEQRAERLTKIETKLDFLIAARDLSLARERNREQ